MTNKDVESLKNALKLEKEAVRRYSEHHEIIKDPSIIGTLEGFQRNEEEHERILKTNIDRLKKNKD